jgi:hypothetical protein
LMHACLILIDTHSGMLAWKVVILNICTVYATRKGGYWVFSIFES